MHEILPKKEKMILKTEAINKIKTINSRRYVSADINDRIKYYLDNSMLNNNKNKDNDKLIIYLNLKKHIKYNIYLSRIYF
jgi:hypothetical protein